MNRKDKDTKAYKMGKDEIVESEAVKKAIGKKTVEMYKAYLKSQVV